MNKDWEMAVGLDNMALTTVDLDKGCLGGVVRPNIAAVGSGEFRRPAGDISWTSPEGFPYKDSRGVGQWLGKGTDVGPREGFS